LTLRSASISFSLFSASAFNLSFSNRCCYYLFDGICKHRMRDDMVYEIIGNFFDNKKDVKGWYEPIKKQNYVAPALNNSADDLPF